MIDAPGPKPVSPPVTPGWSRGPAVQPVAELEGWLRDVRARPLARPQHGAGRAIVVDDHHRHPAPVGLIPPHQLQGQRR